VRGCNTKAKVQRHQSKGSNSKATIWNPRIANHGHAAIQGKHPMATVQRKIEGSNSRGSNQSKESNQRKGCNPKVTSQDQQSKSSKSKASSKAANAGI
jgi:hypothetical protein